MGLQRTKQINTEYEFSKSHLTEMLELELDNYAVLYHKVYGRIDFYCNKAYSYESKNTRVKRLESIIQLTGDVILATAGIKEITTIQSVLPKLHIKMDKLDSIKTALEVLAVCESVGIYTLYHADDYRNPTGTLGIKSNLQMSPEFYEYVDNLSKLPPMLVEPAKWWNNELGGYLTTDESCILGSMNHHSMNQCTDVLNTLQSVEWELDEYMLAFDEASKKPTDTLDKQKQFKNMTTASNKTYQHLLDHGNKFYQVWKFDSRGRMYTIGWQCHLQSTEYKKSILNFAKKEFLS